MCGLNHLSTDPLYADAIEQYLLSSPLPVPVSTPNSTVAEAEAAAGEMLTHSIRGLRGSTQYTVILTASCDSECLRQISKTVEDNVISCSGIYELCFYDVYLECHFYYISISSSNNRSTSLFILSL